MKRSETKKKILSKLKSLDPKDFNQKWNLIFPEEKIDISTTKEKQYFLELLEEELLLFENSDLKKACNILK